MKYFLNTWQFKGLSDLENNNNNKIRVAHFGVELTSSFEKSTYNFF